MLVGSQHTFSLLSKAVTRTFRNQGSLVSEISMCPVSLGPAGQHPSTEHALVCGPQPSAEHAVAWGRRLRLIGMLLVRASTQHWARSCVWASCLNDDGALV